MIFMDIPTFYRSCNKDDSSLMNFSDKFDRKDYYILLYFMLKLPNWCYVITMFNRKYHSNTEQLMKTISLYLNIMIKHVILSFTKK